MSFCFSWKAVSLAALSLSLSAVSLLFDVVVEVDEGSSDGIAAVVSEADTSGSVDDVADSWGEGGGGLEETTSQVPLSTNRKYNRGKVEVEGRSLTCYLQLDRSRRETGSWGHWGQAITRH